MASFNKKQKKILKSQNTAIARAVGCTHEYVCLVLNNKRGNKRSGPVADAIVKKANELLAVLTPKEN